VTRARHTAHGSFLQFSILQRGVFRAFVDMKVDVHHAAEIFQQ
jgi:hypothetical protein